MDKLEQTTATQNANVQEADDNIAGLNADLARALSINQKVINWAKGQTVMLNERVTDAKGKVRTQAQQYTIRGPGAEFATLQDAARDGIAYGFLVQRTLGDDWERGANLWQSKTTGQYYYKEESVGIELPRDIKLNGQPIEKGTPILFDIYDNGVGYFHIHPENGVDANKDFSPRDEKAFLNFYPNGAPSKPPGMASFLGGNDGSFDQLVNNPKSRKGYDYVTLYGPGYFITKRH